MKSKKSFLITLSLILLCTMILTLSACFNDGNDDKKDAETIITVSYYDMDGSILTKNIYNKNSACKISFPSKELCNKDDYNFLGWYYDSAFTSPVQNDTTISTDTAIYGKWVKAYIVTVTSNIEKNIAPFNYYKKISEGETFGNYVKTYYGYNFINCYTDDSCVEEFDFSAPITETTSIYAKWEEKSITIKYNNLYGTMHDNPTSTTYESNPIILEKPKTERFGYFFSCWINDSTQKEIQKIEQHQTTDLSISAKWDDYKITVNAQNEKIYYFGYYPQTVKTKDVTVAENASENGYYLGSDNNYYAKATSSSDLLYGSYYNPTVEGQLGERIASNTVYYFKIEPITWKVLSTAEDGTSVKLWSNIVLDYQCFINKYTKNSGHYYNSYLSTWLNDEFLNTAFNENSSSRIIQYPYKSATAYGSSETGFVLNKIALLDVGTQTYSDLSSKKFASIGRKTVTDYAACLGLGSYTSCYYWLRNISSKYDGSYSDPDNAYVQIYDSSETNCIGHLRTYAKPANEYVFKACGVVPLLWLQL